MPKAPAIPASLAALVTLVGLGLVYWSLTGLGLLTPSGASAPASTGGSGIGSAPGASTGGASGGTLTIPGAGSSGLVGIGKLVGGSKLPGGSGAKTQ